MVSSTNQLSAKLSAGLKKSRLPRVRINSAAIHPELMACFAYCFFKAGNRLKADLDESLAPFGIIPPQYGVLVLLRARGSTNQITLGEEMGIDKATMVRLIDGLEDLGAVERITAQEDRRAKWIAITQKGERLFQKADRARIELERHFLSVLKPAHQVLFRKEMPRLLKHLAGI
jgi:DNA-binding MarR family transcriptional regulator